MWQKVAKFKGAEYFRKALYVQVAKGSVECKSLRHLWICLGGMQIGVGLAFLG